MTYHIPSCYGTDDSNGIFKDYYLNRDGWFLSKINKKYINEYNLGNGFGMLPSKNHDNSLIFKI